MHLATLVEMVESAYSDRVVVGGGGFELTGVELAQAVRTAATGLEGFGAVVYVGENQPLLPVALLAAAWAGLPFVPVNYRLDDEQLNRLISRQPHPFVLADAAMGPRLKCESLALPDWSDASKQAAPSAEAALDDDQVAVVIHTSGTTSEPKAALLRHRHLMSYLLGSVEFASAETEEAVLISVPPYHIAGVANMLSNLYAGRRLVYLRRFDPADWLDIVRSEQISHTMLVPTMLARIVEHLDGRPADTPSLKSLAYGGAKLSDRVLRTALESFPHTDFVNAYGLTETASTVAVLGPDDHRAALTSADPVMRERLSSAGKVLPQVEVEVRDDDNRPLGSGEVGLIFVRGEQIAGEYASGTVLDADGWFCTRDRGRLDDEGYLYIEGRADDTIIRGGENVAPAEIETVLLTHPAVAEACVIGIPDEEWGQRIAAAIVLREREQVEADELQELVRKTLRGSKTPEVIRFVGSLPYTDTGKLLRRRVATEFEDARCLDR